MEKKWHLIVGTVILLVFWYYIKEIKFWMVIIAIPYLIISDLDFSLGEKWHRNFLFHSIILGLIIYLYVKITIPTPFVSLLISIIVFATGLHLLLDITLFPSGWKGTYCLKFIGNRPFFWFVKFNKNKPFTKRGVLTTLWLFINFLLSVILLIIEIIIIS